MKLTPDTSDKALGGRLRAVPSSLQRIGRGNWQLWVGVVFSLGFLVLALHNVDLKETANALHRVNILILGLAVVSHILSIGSKAFRWRLLLAARKEPSFGKAFSVLSIGLMGNAFLPARLGEFVRAYLMGEAETDSKVYVLGTIAVEKVADLLFLLFSLMVLLSQMALPEWLIGPARGTALLIAILLPCFVFLALKRDLFLRIMERASRLVPLAWREELMRQVHYGLDSLEVIHHPRLLIGLLGWSLIIWIVSTLTNLLVFLAFGIVIPIWASVFLVVVLQVGIVVPSSPGRLGVFQYLVILALSIFSVDKNMALGYSVVLYLVGYVPIVVIGCYCLWHEKITWGKIEGAANIVSRLGSKTR